MSTFGFNLVSFVSIQRTYAGSIFHLSLALLESQFFWIGQEIHMLMTLIKNGRTCENALVCPAKIKHFSLIFCSSICLVQELMKDVWSTTHAAKRNILLCLFAQILVYNEGKQCWLVFCFPKNTAPNLGFETNRGKENPQYPCPWLQKRWSHLVKTSRELESLSYQTHLEAFNY